MSKHHAFTWILAIVVLAILWAARKAIARGRELSARTRQREEAFLTRFPEFAGAADAQERRGR